MPQSPTSSKARASHDSLDISPQLQGELCVVSCSAPVTPSRRHLCARMEVFSPANEASVTGYHPLAWIWPTMSFKPMAQVPSAQSCFEGSFGASRC